jgi:catechol 2,3-dioxygenase-like lactoylglutathione lyase family enzyme
MAIQRTEALVFGVDDIAAGTRYFEDWGLEAVERASTGAVFRTEENQTVEVRGANDAALPAAPDAGPTLREAVWGVDSTAALEALGAELARDRDVAADADGTLHTVDESGFAIAFRVAQRTKADLAAPAFNLGDAAPRLNTPVETERRARPIRIGHVVYTVTRHARERASAFYLDRLGFRLTDRSDNLGDFMRCEGARDHHSLGMFHMTDTVRFHHIAFEVRDFDEIMFGGTHMKAQGWDAATNPGRRIVGSNLFWNFKNPCGGQTEYFADMDRMDDDWAPRIVESHPGGAMWELGQA